LTKFSTKFGSTLLRHGVVVMGLLWSES